MTIYANVADEREVGNYMAYVKSVRGNDGLLSDEQMIAFLKISAQTLQNIRFVIAQHPDWDDEDVAEEVLDMEEAALV